LDVIVQSASHVRFSAALPGILAGEEARAGDAARIPGWAAQHTAALDATLAPGLPLVGLALGREAGPPGAMPDLTVLGGRPIYRPSLAYALARCGFLLAEIRALADPLAGADSAVGVWWGLTLAATGQPTRVFQDLLLRQRPTGEFFPAGRYDSPDLHWYDELVVLHAVATRAAHTADAALLAAADRAARFHTEETQPDHATSQPWAIHAFCRSDQTLPLAELLLHGALAQNAGRLDAIGRILLADAVICLA